MVALKGHGALKIDTIASRSRPVKLKMTEETVDGKWHMQIMTAHGERLTAKGLDR
mgnify:FL=1